MSSDFYRNNVYQNASLSQLIDQFHLNMNFSTLNALSLVNSCKRIELGSSNKYSLLF